LRQSSREALAEALRITRARTLSIFDQLSSEQRALSYSPIVNLPLWELGHVGWFQEYWCLRQAEPPRDYRPVRPSIEAQADRLYDSARVAHQRRWALTLPEVGEIKSYLRKVLDATLARLSQLPDTDEALYFHRLCLFHEYMHVEALIYTFQTLGYPLEISGINLGLPGPRASTRRFEAGVVIMGSQPNSGFIFDNEKYAYRQSVAAFEIASQPVSVGEFAEFIEATNQLLPRHWRRGRFGLEQRLFGHWHALPLDHAMANVSAFQAEAYCQWVGRRLPTEAEWQYAAETWKDFNWGRNVWEWTASAFEPFPSFSADPYKEYSEPWFGDHRVVRGGSFATDPGMISSKFRNFYQPYRDDPFIGFRTCAL
jgi:gamma-glutamyl hercynylcysteine S-oxide synthase